MSAKHPIDPMEVATWALARAIADEEGRELLEPQDDPELWAFYRQIMGQVVLALRVSGVVL